MERSWGRKLKDVWESPAVTIVGANETRGTTAVILESLQREECPFTGRIHMVNRKGGTVFGHPAVTSIDEIEGELGIVWLLVGPSGVFETLDAMASRPPRAVIVFSGGFAEAGAADAQERLRRWSQEHDVPLFGPQSLGFLSVPHGLNVLDLRIQAELRPGGIGLISQSGGMLGMLIREMLTNGLGLHSGFSVGNEAAIGYLDLAEALLEDDALAAVGMYVENLGSLTRFSRIAQLAARKGKPLVVLLAGLSETGQRMANSHTGALATPHRLVRGIAEQFGTVIVKDPDQLIAALDALRSAQYRRWGDGRVGFFTGSGGAAVILSDALAESDLEAPQPRPETVTALLGEGAEDQVCNPYDMGAGLLGSPDEFVRRVGTFVADGSFDIGVHLFDLPDPKFAPHVLWADEGIRLAREQGLHPVLATTADRRDRSRAAHYDEHVTISYGIPQTLTKLSAIATWSRGDDGGQIGDPRPRAARRTRVVLGEEMREILRDLPVRWPEEIRVPRDADPARVLADAPFPLVAKAEAGLAHRARAGGVITRIPNLEAAVAAVAYLRALFDADVTMCAHVAHDAEHFLGLSRGPEGQPMIAMGPGGGGVEDNDIGFRLLPMSARQRAVALRRYLPQVAEHTGFGEVIDALTKLMDDERIDSVDLNPLVIDESGAVCALDAKIHLYV